MAVQTTADLLYNVEIQMLHDFVLVKLVDPPEKRQGCIILPQTSEDTPIAQVVDVGPGREGSPATKPHPDLKKGSFVVLQKYIGTKIVLDGDTHLIVKYYDCQSIVKLRDPDGTPLLFKDKKWIREDGKDPISESEPVEIVDPTIQTEGKDDE